ncbi:GNAT family N-acetyltransferase [Saccharothrix sp. NRRL B-16348]|uniref:GNAT family N-acetyltransferase n=1 Tax=Saccharothrix sp. NRRL B-16348 TaxID=1415542 RepID=UPI0012FB7C07|nr:GNAT family N-acetyltransferase [Saccharothrix sp. NRRL B-16348]
MEDDAALLAALRRGQMRARGFSGRGNSMGHPAVIGERAGPVLRKHLPGVGGVIVRADLGGLRGSDLDALIADQCAWATRLGLPIKWNHHDGLPEDLPARLRAAGFRVGEEVTLMIGRAADVAAAATAALPAGVRVREVTDRKDFDRVRQLVEAARDAPWHWLPSALEYWVDDEVDPCTVLVAESADGRVVATGWVRFHTGTDFASTWGGATLPTWRGRGLHRTLVGRHARLAVDRGHHYLYSENLPTSRPTAVRLGFTPVRTLTHTTSHLAVEIPTRMRAASGWSGDHRLQPVGGADPGSLSSVCSIADTSHISSPATSGPATSAARSHGQPVAPPRWQPCCSRGDPALAGFRAHRRGFAGRCHAERTAHPFASRRARAPGVPASSTVAWLCRTARAWGTRTSTGAAAVDSATTIRSGPSTDL